MTTTPQAALLSDDEMRTVDLPTVVIDCLAAPHNLTYVNIGFQDRLHRFAIDVMEETLARVTRDDVLRWYPDLAKLQATQEPVQPPSQQIRICMQIQGGETHSTFAEYMGGDIGYLTFVRREWLPEAPGQQAEPVQAGELPTRAELLEMLRLAKEASADPRRAGRAEAMAIILKTDPEDQLASCVESVSNYPDGDYSEHWVPEKVAELLDCGSDNPMASILDRLEDAYWEVQGRTMDRIANLERDLAEARAALSARKPLSEDLYCRLHTLSKILESSGRIDEQETRDAYPTILDAMNFVRGIGLEVKP